MLPKIMNYDIKLHNFFKQLNAGHIQVPNFVDLINPPSLIPYYQTLPKYWRENPYIRNMLYAMEYHKPNLTIRQKELAMNFGCSLLRPIEGRMRDVLIEVASSQKIRMNMAMGKEMMNELKFYELDITELGEKSDDEVQEEEFDISAFLA